MEEERIKKLIKTVRKWCIIVSVIALIAIVIFTTVKIVALSGLTSAGIENINNMESDPEGAGKVFGTFLVLFASLASGFGAIALIVIALIKIASILALIWIGFLIFYLVQKSALKKLKENQTQVVTKAEPEPQTVVKTEPEPKVNTQNEPYSQVVENNQE